MKKLLFIFALMIFYPATALCMETGDLQAGIGYLYTPGEPGMLGVEYNLWYFYDRATSSENAADLTRSVDVTRYEIENAFLISYNPINRFSLFLNVPYEYKFHQYEYDNSDHQVTGIGDILAGIKIQITDHNQANPLVNFVIGGRFKTGTSPFEINPREEIATGEGYNSIKGIVTISKNFDSIMPYLGIHYSYNMEVDGLNDFRYYDYIEEVNPGSEGKVDFGVTGSISDTFSYLAAIEYCYTWGGEYVYRASGRVPVAESASAKVHAGGGFKIGKVQLNPRLSIGVSEDAPDFTFNLKIPFSFAFSGSK